MRLAEGRLSCPDANFAGIQTVRAHAPKKSPLASVMSKEGEVIEGRSPRLTGQVGQDSRKLLQQLGQVLSDKAALPSPQNDRATRQAQSGSVHRQSVLRYSCRRLQLQHVRQPCQSLPPNRLPA